MTTILHDMPDALGLLIRLWLIWIALRVLAPAFGRRLLRVWRARRWQPDPGADPVQAALDRHLAVDAPAGALAAAIVTPSGTRRCYASHVDGRGSPAPDANTRFEIGSITKTLTATLLAAMQRTGQVDLTTPVDYLLPDMARMGRQSPRPITLEDLVTQHSGLPRLPWGWAMLAGLYLRPRQPYAWISESVLLRWLRGRRVRRVGLHYRYSNLGFGLLGLVLARRAQCTYEEALRRQVLEPLGMTATGLPSTTATPDRQAMPHGPLGFRRPPWNLHALAAAGGLRSSLDDMLRWLRANLDLQAPIDASLHAPRADAGAGRHIAMGWQISGHGDTTVVWHNGGTGGSRSLIAFAPVHRTGVVVLSSQAVSVDDLGMRLLGDAIRAAHQRAPRADAA
jgi:CubicO group peptidase (beta-lactamase class C family)